MWPVLFPGPNSPTKWLLSTVKLFSVFAEETSRLVYFFLQSLSSVSEAGPEHKACGFIVRRTGL